VGAACVRRRAEGSRACADDWQVGAISMLSFAACCRNPCCSDASRVLCCSGFPGESYTLVPAQVKQLCQVINTVFTASETVHGVCRAHAAVPLPCHGARAHVRACVAG
jgi:hypothetical protein